MDKVKIPNYSNRRVWIRSSKDWANKLYRVSELHRQGYRGQGVKIAVIDTGINPKHPEFRKAFEDGRLAIHSTVGDKGIDREGHGSWCASRYIGNTLGFVPDCQLHSIKALGDNGEGAMANVVKAFELAVALNVDVISASIGWAHDGNNPLRSVIRTAKSRGILIFAAAGNDGRKNDIDAPACYDDVISVGGFNSEMKRGNYSDYGLELDLYAPGDGKGAYTGKAIAHLVGTSMATPTAGACFALIRQHLLETTGSADFETIKKIVTCI